MRRSGFTVLELLMASGVVLAACSIGYTLQHTTNASFGRPGTVELARRSAVEKAAVTTVALLGSRIAEGLEILSPPPGTTADKLIIRDALGNTIQFRCDEHSSCLISEQMVVNVGTRETARPVIQANGRACAVGWPLCVPDCPQAQFTALSPNSVLVHLSLGEGGTLNEFFAIFSTHGVFPY